MKTLTPRPARKTQVTHVILQLRTGGMEKLLVEFARHADRDRFDLRFLCLGGHGPVADEIAACDWEVKCLGFPPGLRPDIVYRLTREFVAAGADVVHTHNNVPLIYGGPAARLSGASAVVHTRHGRTVGTGRRQREALRIASLTANRFVCVSEDSRRLSATEGIPDRKLAVIHNGIDTARFNYRGPSAGGPAVMVGRLAPVKGADVLLRAVAMVAGARPDFRLEVAGDGPVRPDLEALARDLGLGERVRFLGNVDDVPALLGRASSLVLPSLSEGVSLTLLEAMARGLPVVATRVGGNPEVVEDGVSGRLVPPGDAAALAAALLEVWPGDDRTRSWGPAGRARVEQRFDVRQMVAGYEALYRQLTSRSCARHKSAGVLTAGS